MNGANAAKPGVSVFSGGGNLYFMDSKSKRVYQKNTRSKRGKELISSFLKDNKMKVVKQNGGHLLTQDGRVYLSKDKKNAVSVGGGDDFSSKNLGHVYQTQGGARKQNKKSNNKQNNKQNKKSNNKQNKKSNRKSNKQNKNNRK